MARRQRYLVAGLIGGFLLLLALIFQQALMANVILPMATVVWLLLRIFVLSIGQQVYWWVVIIVVALIALVRLFQEPLADEPPPDADPNPALERVHQWRITILYNQNETGDYNLCKRNLLWLLTSLYAAKQQGPANAEMESALRQGQIPVPARVYDFLLAQQPPATRPAFYKHPIAYGKQTLHALRQMPRRWARQWSGRAAAEYYQAIDEALTLMENSLEMRHDGSFDDPDR